MRDLTINGVRITVATLAAARAAGMNPSLVLYHDEHPTTRRDPTCALAIVSTLAPEDVSRLLGFRPGRFTDLTRHQQRAMQVLPGEYVWDNETARMIRAKSIRHRILTLIMAALTEDLECVTSPSTE